MRTRDLPTLMKVGFAAMVAYRAEMLIWILTVTAPIISLLVWDRVAEGGPMGRFDQATLGRYFLATIVVRQFSGAWIAWVLNYEIRTGGLNAPLLKPSNPLWYYVAENLASHPFRLVVLVPLLGLLVLWRPEFAFIPDPTALALGVTAVALAWAINFASQVAFGALAFRLQQSLGLFNTWFGLSMLLSGYLFPLELAPRWARPVLNALPFRAMVATPVETLTGLRGPAEALQAVGVQALWLGFFTALAALLWRRGIRHYEAVGGVIAGVWALVRASLMTALQYRASFWGEAATALLWTTGALIPLFVVYGQTQGVAGWTWSESLLVMGFFITLEGLLDAFVEPNLRAVVEHVRQGTLDFVLLKPIDAQLHVSLHRTAPTRLTHTVAGLGVVAWAARDLGPSAGDWVAAAVLLASGVAILHAIWTLVICTSFWFVRIDNLSFLLRSVLDAGRWPLGFYRGAVRFALTFLLPVGLMTTFPALALRGALSPAAGGMALGVAAVFVVAARVGWTVALRQYSSASS